MKSEDHANFVAAKIVADAEAYLDDRLTRAGLSAVIERSMIEVFMLPAIGDRVSDAARLLLITMMHVAKSDGERELRWRELMRGFCRHVRFESQALLRGDA